MCGIIGYIGKKKAGEVLFSGLKRLEYRGYDSYGICVLNNFGEPIIHKKVGKISEENFSFSEIEGNIGIGHTRWATTGKVTVENAHPHFDCKKEIFIVHNGIIENYKTLKRILEKRGHKFSSQCDTEVIAHLIEEYFNENLEEAVRKALKHIRGTYGILVLSPKDPQKIVGSCFSSPLILGIGENELLVASDPSALISYTRQIITLEDKEVVVLKPNDFFILKEKPIETIEWDEKEVEKGEYPHFMLKEIMEGPEAVKNSIKGRLIPERGIAKLGGLENVKEKLSQIETLHIIGCGTAFYAGMVGEYMIEEYGGIPVEVDVASEFRYRKPVLSQNSACLFISQSGETADTLEALREVKRKGILSLGIVNMPGSSIARETDAGIYNHIGPEIGVAATKSFVSQLAILVLFTLFLGRQRGLSLIKGQRIAKDLQQIPQKIKEILSQKEKIKEIAQKYSKFSNFIYLGRKYNYPLALEGALKLKEIAYPIHAEGYAGGEMKHGPLALADENFPFLVIALSDSVYEKIFSNIQEIKTRNAPVIAIASEGNEEIKKIVDDVIYIPKTSEMLTPLLVAYPLHLFAYYMGVIKGNDVDKPRNLAKSVTVE